MSLWKRPTPTPPKPEPRLPTKPVVYPSGICVHSPSGYYLINKDGKKYRIVTKAILDSWRFPLVVETSDVAISSYPTGVTKLWFRDGTLLTNIADGKMYVASNGTLRHIVSPEVLERLGVTQEDFVVVSDDEINLMKVGERIN